jgi:hypothetical protein
MGAVARSAMRGISCFIRIVFLKKPSEIASYLQHDSSLKEAL